MLLLRALASLALLSPVIWRNRAAFRTIQRPGLQVLRVVLSTLEVAAFFAASVYLPLADVITYYLAGPIFVTALSGLVLGEHIGWRRWTRTPEPRSPATTARPERSMTPDRSDRLPDAPLAAAARRLLRGVRVSTVSSAERDRAIALLDEATAILGQEESPGPYWLTGLTSFEDFELTADLATVHTYSPALGEANPSAPEVELEVTDDLEVRGTVRFSAIHNGPPWNTCHGGVVALVYDDIVGLAAMVGAGGGGSRGRRRAGQRPRQPL